MLLPESSSEWRSNSNEGSIWDDMSNILQGGTANFTSGWASILETSLDIITGSDDQNRVLETGAELYGHIDGEDTSLCPLLIVHEEQGVTLTVDGQITPEPQQAVLKVTQQMRQGLVADNHDSNADGQLVTIYAAENNNSEGILLESALGFQVAYLDTRIALRGSSACPSVDIVLPHDESFGNIGPDRLEFTKEHASFGDVYAVATRTGFGMVEIRRMVKQKGLQKSASSSRDLPQKKSSSEDNWAGNLLSYSSTDNAAASVQAEAQPYCVENRIFSNSGGLAYRTEAVLNKLDGDRMAKWGTVVHGTRLENGPWLQVGDKFLPIRYDGVRLLRPQGQLLMLVRIDASCQSANIVDGNGLLLASMQTRRNDSGSQMMVVQVGMGVDAGLVLSSLVAALKLGIGSD